MQTTEYPKVYLYRQIVQAKLFIDANYHRAIDLALIAKASYFSKFHFVRLFKKIYGKTPHQYLIKVRIDRAMLLLRSGNSVSETCLAVGFESETSFSGLFKRVAGMTPSAFAAHQRELNFRMQQAPQFFIPGCHIKMER